VNDIHHGADVQASRSEWDGPRLIDLSSFVRSKDSNMASRYKLQLVKLGVLALGACVSVSAALAQGGSAEQQAVEQRQALFKEVDKAFKPVGEMLKRKMPYDAAAVQEAAAKLDPLARKIPDAFAVDTHKATGIKTKARENIWSSLPDFKAKSEDLVKAIAGLSAAAKSGDEKAFRPAAVAVGKACSGCHDNFKDSD
jgi:cytochrome c556